MPTYNVQFYDLNPSGVIPTGTGSTFEWNGPADYDGTATIVDNEGGGGDQYLDDDSNGGEQATGNATVGGLTSTNVTMDAELVWTVTDNVTGATFQVIQFQVEAGDAQGFYTMSEVPLIAGRSYTVNDYDSNPDASSGDIAFTYADYVEDDGIVQGTSGNDVIDHSYADAENEQIDTNNASGDDSVTAGAGDDTVYGGVGNDTLLGETGNDVIYGDDGGTDPDGATETLNWDLEGGNGTDLSAGFTQNTGTMDVSVSFANDGNNNPTYEIDTANTQYVAGGETYADDSSLFLFGNGDSDTSTTTIDFAAAAGTNVDDSVENVTFRINDIDWGSGNHTDILTVNAFDADGNPVTVTLTPAGGDTVSGNTVTANAVANSTADADGSVLVSIAGPVSSIEIEYGNLQSGTQGIWVTDVEFETIPIAEGDDSILGGDGDDSLYGEIGNDFLDGGADNDYIEGGTGTDTLQGGTGDDSLIGGTDADLLEGGAGSDTLVGSENDTLQGGDGDDYIQLEDLGEAGAGTISIDGGTGAQSDGDTLDLNGLADRATLIRNVDPLTGETSGSVTLLDGTVVTFSNIDQVICFTPGTKILTESGFRPIEDLKIGDGLITMDNGIQPLAWIGSRTVPAFGIFAPVRLRAGALPGLENDILVSPQHKMLLKGQDIELHFGTDEVFAAAQLLENGDTITREVGGEVTYIHLMLPQHEVIYAEGAPTESFHVGKVGLNSLSSEEKEDLFDAFPHLRFNPDAYGPSARRCLRSFETAILLGTDQTEDQSSAA